MVRDTWDVEARAVRYREFVERWRGRGRVQTAGEDPLGVQLVLLTDWLQVVRTDPRLPLEHLPAEILDVVPSDAGASDALPGGEA
jgi:phenylacetic acid degradation operon negative regulatory protein